LQSSENVKYQPVSYRKDIIEWLENCMEIAVRHPMVRETIIQFINHLKKITNQDMDTKNQSEIIELLMQSNNLRSAQVIYQNYKNVFNVLADKYFCPKMGKFAKQKQLDFHYEESGEYYIAFYFTKQEWNGKIWLGFKKDSSGYYYGLCNDPSNKENNLKILANRLENKDFKSSQWWVCYKYLNLNLDNWINDIISSDRFFKDCVEKISELLDALKDLKF
jgi:hypothetical protein